MVRYLFIIALLVLVNSCKNKKNELIGNDEFLSNYNNNQLGVIKNNVRNTSIVIKKEMFHDSIIGYNVKACIGVNEKEYLFKYDGFVFLQNGQVFTISSGTNKPYKILDFNLNKGESIIINNKQRLKIIFEDVFFGNGNGSVFKYRIKNISFTDLNNIGTKDAVIFINPFDGIVGLYYSVIPFEKSDNKEIIYFTQGDIMLFNNNYDSVILGIRNPK